MQTQAATQDAIRPETDIIDLDAVRSADLFTFPYEHIITPGFIKTDRYERMLAGYPRIEQAGSFPLSAVNHGADFKQLIDEMNGDAFRKAVEEKFSVDLTGKPTMFTVRGRCRLRDGQVHTDSESKIITVLLYMNPVWQKAGGKLRLLRSKEVDDVVTEISPDIGTLLIFKNAPNAWHGHLPYEGERRVIQMNWVTEQKYVDREQKRHGISSWVKGLLGGGY
jgi:SM-20-related protein